MVYGTVRGHGGMIEVESAPDQGSAFTIYLPASTSAVVARPISSRDSNRIRVPSRLALVVDDEPTVRAIATRILRHMGLSVVGASDGAEALEVFAARRDEISIVVLDMSMPVMGGAECLREIRRTSRVPVVIASGFANESETQNLLAQGNTVFLEKPYSVEQMRGQVQRLLEATP
jgi:CheY-like chemotaxis protein